MKSVPMHLGVIVVTQKLDELLNLVPVPLSRNRNRLTGHDGPLASRMLIPPCFVSFWRGSSQQL